MAISKVPLSISARSVFTASRRSGDIAAAWPPKSPSVPPWFFSVPVGRCVGVFPAARSRIASSMRVAAVEVIEVMMGASSAGVSGAPTPTQIRHEQHPICRRKMLPPPRQIDDRGHGRSR